MVSVTVYEFGFKTLADQVQRVDELRAHGYVTVFSQDGYLVMHAPGS